MTRRPADDNELRHAFNTLTRHEIARRYGVNPRTVTRWRTTLGLGPGHRTTDPDPADLPRLARALTTRTRPDDGHLIWRGPVHTHRLTPVLGAHSARRIAWLLHHGTPPVGTVRVTCGETLCVEVGHLADAAGTPATEDDARIDALYAAITRGAA